MTAVLHQPGDIKLLLHRNFTVFSHKYAMMAIDIDYDNWIVRDTFMCEICLQFAEQSCGLLVYSFLPLTDWVQRLKSRKSSKQHETSYSL